MKYNNIMNLSILQIQIFLKCYEYCNYSRVAEEYNFTPSMISKTIKNMEQLLGLKLFERKYHILVPTPSADELVKGWTVHANGILETIYRACDIQDQIKPKIRIGMLETTKFCADYILLKLEQNSSASALDNVEWERRDMHNLPSALEADTFDLVITWSGELRYFTQSKTKWKKVFSSPDALFIPRDHPLSGKPLSSFSECRSYPFITLSPTTYPHYYDYLENICRKNGFSPIISTICGSTDSARYNLNLGKGLYVAPSLICCDWENDEVEKKELQDETTSSLIIAWKTKKESPELLKIINMITH